MITKLVFKIHFEVTRAHFNQSISLPFNMHVKKK